jgi:DNA-binding response OmpR family regulator
MSKKILLVDDDEGILEAVKFGLEMEGYVLETTDDGDEVYSKVINFQPHVIILDILLSGKDGREICRRLKDDKLTRNIPVIMMSAHPNVEQTVKACGANDFLSKPFDMDVMLRTIEQEVN